MPTPDSRQLEHSLRNALAAQAAGNLAQARECCQRILSVAPATVDAWHILGVVELQSGQTVAARIAVDRAIELAPTQGALYLTRVRIYETMGEWDAALADCAKVQEVAPDSAEVWLRQARVYRRSGRTTEALACFEHYLVLRPDDASVWFNRGNALGDLGRLPEAIDSYAQSIALRPDFADAAFNLGTALLAAGRPDEAILAFEQLLERQPAHVDGRINLGNAWRRVNQEDSARLAYESALAINPARADAHNNLASIELASDRFEAALLHFDAAIRLEPGHAIFHQGRASTLKQLGRLDEALAAFDQSVDLAPDYVEAHTSRSLCQLLAGRLAEGFREYEWRWQAPDLADIKPDFVQPRWLGAEEIRGKRVLVRWEQGLGDSIQFCRYVAMLNALGAKVILQVQAPLLALMRGLRGEGTLLADTQPVSDFDYYVPMLSLPWALRTELATIPAAERYLWADSTKLAAWRESLGERRGLRVGLAWSGRPEHKNDRQRSLALAEFLDALPVGPEYFVLQKEIRGVDAALLAARPDLRHLAADFADFSDTAAVCEQMDLVVSVDTSIAHLAGALGRRLFLLLPFVPDWRWLMGRDDSPWYPSARLFRQGADREWAPVLNAVRLAVTHEFEVKGGH